MATEATKLVLKFADAESKEISHSFSNADKNAQPTNVKALANGMVANGDIYTRVPVTVKSASIVTTTTTPIDIS